MASIIGIADLPSSVTDGIDEKQLDIMLDGANATAVRVAPCLAATGEDAPTDDQIAEAKLVLLGAVTRWSETGSGAWQQETTGPFSVTLDTRQRTGYKLWPSEIEQLQGICKTGGSSGAFSVDTAPTGISLHALWCAASLGANYCDCGVDIAGYPIYG